MTNGAAASGRAVTGPKEQGVQQSSGLRTETTGCATTAGDDSVFLKSAEKSLEIEVLSNSAPYARLLMNWDATDLPLRAC